MPGKSIDENAGNGECNSPGNLPGAYIISYNLNEGERPEGLKVRWKVRIETGKRARALDQRQAEAIKEYLEWAREYLSQQEPPPPQS